MLFGKNKANIKLLLDISYSNGTQTFLEWALTQKVSFSVEVQFYNGNWESVEYTYLLLATTNRSLNRKRCRSCLCRPRLSSTRPSISRVLLEHIDDDRKAPVSMLAEGLSLQQPTPQTLSQMITHRTECT